MLRLFFRKYCQSLSAALVICLLFFCGSIYHPNIAFGAGTLTVTISGTGSGTVNNSSLPSGLIACPGDCSETFASSDSITLTPFAAANSLFAGWSGDCTGSGDCILTMTTSLNVTATFNPNYRVGIGHEIVPRYATITEAYSDTLRVVNQSIIWATVATLSENVTLNRSISIDLNGGTENGLPTAGYTTIDGTLDASAGFVNISQFIVNDLVVGGGLIEIESLIIQ